MLLLHIVKCSCDWHRFSLPSQQYTVLWIVTLVEYDNDESARI